MFSVIRKQGRATPVKRLSEHTAHSQHIAINNDHPTRETMSLEEATVSTMWEIAELVEVLERLGGII
jgi:hypothetical protein